MEVQYVKRVSLHGGKPVDPARGTNRRTSFYDRNEYFEAVLHCSEKLNREVRDQEEQLRLVETRTVKNQEIIDKLQGVIKGYENSKEANMYEFQTVEKLNTFFELIHKRLGDTKDKLTSQIHSKKYLRELNRITIAKVRDDCERNQSTIIVERRAIFSYYSEVKDLLVRKKQGEEMFITVYADDRDPYAELIGMLMSRNYDRKREFALNIAEGVKVTDPLQGEDWR
jgi:hypothetical protein